MKKIRNIDEKLISYNIEMTEITGGTFWKAYTQGQIAGTEEFRVTGQLDDFTSMADLMQYFPPINLYDEKLRKLAKEIGPSWVRVSGSWATKTYYDFEEKTNGIPPKGYASVLTKEQWIGVLDFVKSINGKLLVSVSNCEGDHVNGGEIDLKQTKKIFDISHEYGVDIDAIEFMNEPNMMEMSGAPKGYTAEDYVRDQDIVNNWVRNNYPKCLIVGPCTLGDGSIGNIDKKALGAGIGMMMKMCTTDDLMRGSKIPLNVFSYHYYNGISERLASVLPAGHWDATKAHTDEYLSIATINAKMYSKLRDKYVPGGQIWVTESGDAGGGGNTWASTYLDVFRTLNELGSFVTITDGIIFHNTLASSDYGFLKHGTFEPRPNYFAVLLWKNLMGNEVFDCSKLEKNDTHIYCHSRKDGKDGYAYLVINNSVTEIYKFKNDKKAKIYVLNADTLRSSIMKCNGIDLKLIDNELPNIEPLNVTGNIEIMPLTCAFIII